MNNLTSVLDPLILGQILLLQSILQAAPDEERLAEMLKHSLAELPGIGEVTACIHGIAGGGGKHCCAISRHYPTQTIEKNFLFRGCPEDCPIEREPKWMCFPLITSKCKYGSLFLECVDHTAFLPYEPFVTNTANLVSLQIENTRHQSALETLNTKLESQVRERTETLRENERKYRLLADNAIDVIWSMDMDLVFTYVSPSVQKISGYTSEEAMQVPLEQVFTPTSYRQMVQTLKKELAWENNQGIPPDRWRAVELDMVGKDGGIIPVEINASFLRDKAGSPIALTGITRDIGERKRAEDALRKSEELLAEMTRQVPGVLFQFYSRPNGEMGLYYVSQGSKSILGIEADPQKFLDQFIQLIMPERREPFLKSIENAVKEIKPWHYEEVIEKVTGKRVWLSAHSLPSVRETEIVFNGIIQDITERKKAEQELNSQRTLQRTLVNTLPDLVWLKNPDGFFMGCNTRFEQLLGKKEEEILGKDDDAFFSPESADFYRYHDRLAIEKGEAITSEEETVFADDGHREILEIIRTPMYAQNGALIGVLGIGRDITGRKLKEKIQAAKLRLIDFASIHSTLELLQHFLDEAESLTGSEIGFYHFVEENQQTLSLQTWSTNTLKNICTAKGAGLHYPVSEAGVWTDCVETGKPVIHNDYIGLKHRKGFPEGHAPVIRELVVPVLRNEKIVAIIGVGNKITDYTADDVETLEQLSDLSWDTIIYKRAEDARRESDERYRSMMDAMHDAAYICSSDFRIEYMNPAMIRKIGRAATDEICYEVIHGRDERCPWCPMSQIRQNESVKIEIQSPKDGRFYQVSSSPLLHRDGSISKMTIYTDITQIIEAEVKLRQSQKLESIGSLAGGIAHDFNNILFPIIGMSEMLMDDLAPGSPEKENAEEIFKAGKRGGELVKQILAFSRQSDQKKVPTRIQHILKEVLKLTRATIPSNIEIHNDIQSDCGLIMADPTQIHQVAMNIITNAYHAVEAEGGQISVRLKESFLKTSDLSNKNLIPGNHAILTISDTGYGISTDVMDKIFDPYFTTKDQGKGTGLGLAVVYGIIQGHKGDIDVYSEIGKGTTFQVYLPVMEKSAKDLSNDEAQLLPMGSERILLVDDEQPIANLEKQILERLGYHVTVRINSLEALEAFRANPYAFDLVISDMTMPYLTGDRLTREIKNIRSDIPVIVCTGFSERIDEEKAREMGIRAVLMKPLVRVEFAKMVRKALDEVRGNSSQ